MNRTTGEKQIPGRPWLMVRGTLETGRAYDPALGSRFISGLTQGRAPIESRFTVADRGHGNGRGRKRWFPPAC